LILREFLAVTMRWGAEFIPLGFFNGFYALSKTAEAVGAPPHSYTPLGSRVLTKKNPLRMAACFVKPSGIPKRIGYRR
jgi:hypothetical protein